MGGVQTPTVIKSAGIEAGSTFDGIFHITDWFATFGNIAGYKPEGETDSIDQLEALKVTLENAINSKKVFNPNPDHKPNLTLSRILTLNLTPILTLTLILNIISILIFRIYVR